MSNAGEEELGNGNAHEGTMLHDELRAAGSKRKAPDEDGPQCIFKNQEEGPCQFCSTHLNVDEGVILQSCAHTFCRECLAQAVELQRELLKIPCPLKSITECEGHLYDSEIKQIVRPEIYDEYIDRSLVVAKKKMHNAFTCKSDGCAGWCELVEDRRSFDCPLCGRTNCVTCQAIHPGVTCDEYKELYSTGQSDKVKELIEKEEKSGFFQLMESIKSSPAKNDGDVFSSFGIINQIGLLPNTLKFECPVCFMEIEEGMGVILKECLHPFCKECLVHQVEYSETPTVKCPYIDGNYSCTGFITPCEIKALVPPELHEKHLEKSIRLGESSLPTSFHCRTPNCPGWCDLPDFENIADQDKKFHCPVCHKMNCIKCKAIHNGSCKDYQESLKNDKNIALSEKVIEVNTVNTYKMIAEGKCMRCSHCKLPVMKVAGCDWLQCSACRTELCWATKGPRWGPRGHGDTSGGCRCRVGGKPCHPKCRNCH